MLICGVDEAGRGPVLGDLVMAGVLIDKKNIPKLKKLGVRDSKLLTKEKREELYEKILKIVKSYKIISIKPNIIDKHLRSDKSSLNILEAETTAEILNHLNPETVYIDLPDRNPERYKEHILKNLKNKNIILITEYKADLNYPIVSAASIIAKVTRDKHIEELRNRYGDFGSGYPSDPKTQEFLEENWNNPKIDFIRREWVSWKNLKREKTQKRLFEFK